jgi:hypothetical protein
MKLDQAICGFCLRAPVHYLNANFADYMRQNGQKRKVCFHQASEDSSDAEEEPEAGQLLLTESQIEQWVKEVKCSYASLCINANEADIHAKPREGTSREL